MAQELRVTCDKCNHVLDSTEDVFYRRVVVYDRDEPDNAQDAVSDTVLSELCKKCTNAVDCALDKIAHRRSDNKNSAAPDVTGGADSETD